MQKGTGDPKVEKCGGGRKQEARTPASGDTKLCLREGEMSKSKTTGKLRKLAGVGQNHEDNSGSILKEHEG